MAVVSRGRLRSLGTYRVAFRFLRFRFHLSRQWRPWQLLRKRFFFVQAAQGDEGECGEIVKAHGILRQVLFLLHGGLASEALRTRADRGLEEKFRFIQQKPAL